MRLSHPSCAVAVSAALVCALAEPVVAQSQRPPVSIFGPDGIEDRVGRPSLDLLIETYEGLGQDPQRPADGLDQSLFQDGSWYSGIMSSVAYRRKGRHGLFVLNGGHAARYYAERGPSALQHDGRIGFEAVTGRRTIFRIGALATYSPYHQLLAMPDIGPPGTPSPIADVGVSTSPAISYSGSLGLARQVGRHTELSFDAGARLATLGEDGDRTTAYHAGAMFKRQLNRTLALKLGDTVRVLESPDGQRTTSQDITLGFDYGKALAFSRRTRLAFNTGSAIASTELGRHFGVIGAAHLSHEFGRTWSLTGTVDRSLRVVELLPGPFMANSAGVLVGGGIGRRVSLRVRGAYSFGSVDLEDGDAGRYTGVITETRAGVALGRYFQLYAEHLYYQHQFPDALALPSGVSHRRAQHAARAGLNVWAPLVRAGR